MLKPEPQSAGELAQDHIMFRSFFALAIALLMPVGAIGEEASTKRSRIGYGLVFSNDLFGDGKDRWRTGSVTSSRIYSGAWQGQAPRRFGDLLELRIQGQIMAPENLRLPNAADRPWAGALNFELHSHVARGASEMSLGAGLSFVGPQTQLDDLQTSLHDLFSAPQPSAAVLSGQIGNKIRPVIAAEFGHQVALSQGASLRPFVEARAGDETYLRTGVDFTLGQLGQDGLQVREHVTGQHYSAVAGATRGLTLTAGADIAYVADSLYLPEQGGYALENLRHRARLGVKWQGEAMSAFYGLTYLSEEFSTQREGQLSGSLQIQMRF